ncbi:general transcription factor II-I repeat domain-containing protein 2A [Trichonephila clavipes]|nr:general transcription factor II-I repeat domain-containing protein 2A [Trichonephila clavipes]
MASSTKKQKVYDSKCSREFQTWWAEKDGMINKGHKAVCVLCSETVVCRTSSVKRHFETNHKSFLLCEGNTRNRWRDGQVCPDVGQGTMAPWARRLGREGREREKTGERERERRGKKNGEETEKEREIDGKRVGERERSPPCMEKRAESEIGVERR